MQPWEVVDRETQSCLMLEASLSDRIRHLSQWHVDFAKEHKRSFNYVLDFLLATGHVPQQSEVHLREIHSFLKRRSEAERKIFTHQLMTLSELPCFTPVGKILLKQDSRIDDQERLRRALDDEKREIEEAATLHEHFENSLAALQDSRISQVIKGRLGVGLEAAKTLAALALEFGVTRERIRQIEKKNLEKIERFALWDDIFRDKCEDIFESVGPLILVQDLQDFDPWFAGFSLPIAGWRTFLKYMASGLVILNQNDQVALTSKRDSLVVRQHIVEIESGRRSARTESSVLDDLNLPAQLIDNGDYYLSALLKMARVSEVTVSALVRKALDSAIAPIGMEDVLAYQYKNALTVRNSHPRTILNELTTKGTPISRAPTKFIARHTLGLSEIDLRTFCDEFYSFWLSSFDENRVFHADEILEWVSRTWSRNQRFAQYTESSWWAVAPLVFDPENRFKKNKLNVWLSEAWGDAQPTKAEDLIEELLRVKAVPMSATEIIRALHPMRGVGDTFQIHPRGRIKALGRGRWQFKDRD